jgi:uncharacterized membrane protein YccC
MLGVSLGAVIGALVSVTILPSSREVLVARLTAKIIEEFAGLLRNAVDPAAGDPNSRDRLEYRVRQSLRELVLLIRDRPDALPAKGPAAAMVKFTVQMHADITFLKRELQTSGPSASPSLDDFAQAFDATVTQVAAMARGRSGPPDIAMLREKCAQATQSLSQNLPHSEGARLMLRRLVEDLAALIRSIERARPTTTPEA